jgi:hypothetical protein
VDVFFLCVEFLTRLLQVLANLAALNSDAWCKEWLKQDR